MTINTGFTPNLPDTERARNEVIASIQNIRAAIDVDGREYWTNRAALALANEFATLSTRRYEIEARLDGFLSDDARAELVGEMLEIDAKLAPFDQVGDARLMMKFGTSL